MPRKPRIEFEGAFYHVIVRGNQKQKIFRAAADFQKYLQLLATYRYRCNCNLYAYVLMGNHVHLLIETGDVPLSRILQGINQSYTMYFNKAYRTVGHLFQGRYKAILCDRDAYLLDLLKYTHYNPVRARIAEAPGSYPWSSHRAYIGKANPYGLVDTAQALKMFSERPVRARKLYRDFMNYGEVARKEEVYATIDQRLQGDDEFVDRVLKKYDGEVRKERKKKECRLPEIARAVEEHAGVTLAQLRSQGKEQRVMAGRRLFTLMAKAYGYKGMEVAQYLRKEPSSVTKYARGEGMRPDVEQVIKMLQMVRKKGNFRVRPYVAPERKIFVV